jgi:hypothetical protein
MDVQYPDILKGGYLACTRKLIDACPPEQRQPVLDEIGAMHARGKVRSPLGLLKSLIEKAKSGEFSPNCSLSADRSSPATSRSPVHARQSSTDTPTAPKAPVPVSEIGAQKHGLCRQFSQAVDPSAKAACQGRALRDARR